MQEDQRSAITVVIPVVRGFKVKIITYKHTHTAGVQYTNRGTTTRVVFWWLRLGSRRRETADW